jgi:hypothetical protein
MRLQIAGVLLIAGTLAACSSSPPPPVADTTPPPAAPAPAPATQAASGTYHGTAVPGSDATGCRPLRGTQTARIHNGAITIAGLRGRIAEDGTITGRGLSGTATGNTANVTVTKGRCSYVYSLST